MSKALSSRAVTVLRIVVEGPQDPAERLQRLQEAVPDRLQLLDALRVLEGRFLITWEGHGRVVRPRARGVSLLRMAAYRDRCTL